MLISKISFCSNFDKKTGKKQNNNQIKRLFQQELPDTSKCIDNESNTCLLTNFIQYKNKDATQNDYFDILFKRLLKDPTKISVEFLSDLLSELINQDIVKKFHLYEHFNGIIISDIERYKLNDGTYIDKNLYDLVSSGKLETSKWDSLLEDSHMQILNDKYNLLFGQIDGNNIINISPSKSDLIYSISFTHDGQFKRLVISNRNRVLKCIDKENSIPSSNVRFSLEQCIFPELLYKY